MSTWTGLFGGGATPIGAIVSGQFASDASFLPCDGSDQLKVSYPLLDTSNLSTIGANAIAMKTVPTAGQNAVVAAGNTLVMVTSSTAFAQVSTDGGNTWSQKALAAAAGSFVALAYGNGAIVLTYANATQVQVSTDGGNTWVLKALGSMGSTLHRVRFAGGLFFVFVDPSSTAGTYYATSPDGITWTLRAAVGGTGFIDVAYNASNGKWLFVAFQQSGGGLNMVWVSYDGGATLVQVTTNVSANWTGIACDNMRYLVACSAGVMSSVDGVAWSQIAATTPGVTGSTVSLTAGTVRYLGGMWCILPGAGYSRITLTPDFQRAYQINGTPAGGMGSADYIPSLGRFAFSRQDSGGANIATLDVDTTKFRTPYMPKVGDGDRYYIKAK